MTIKIKQLPENERPYEKLEIYGEKMLSNAELLAIIIKSGTKENTSVELANKILSMQCSKTPKLSKQTPKGLDLNSTTRNGNSKLTKKSNKNRQMFCTEESEELSLKSDEEDVNLLQSLQNISIEEFQQIKGIGKVKAIQLKAVCELARRMSKPTNNTKIKVKSSQDVANLLMDELRFEKVEFVKVVLLNAKNIIIKIIDISKGGTNSAIVEPKEILQEAIKTGTPRIVLVHNHPSGDPTPSVADIEMTKKLYHAASILGIQLLDHIVIGDRCYTSIFSIERIVENKNGGI